MFEKFRKNIGDAIQDVKNTYGIGVTQAFDSFSSRVNSLFVDREFFDDEFFDDFEERLIELDIVPLLAVVLRDKLEKKILNSRVSKEAFQEAIYDVIIDTVDLSVENTLNLYPEQLNVLLIMGVNGVGKTTTISKLINKYKKEFNVEVVAGDTFRAGAIEQLNMWADKLDVPITKTHEGHSSSAVVYEGLVSAKNNDRNLVICDTAGRLHNKDNLMDELKKITISIEKAKENLNLMKEINVKKLLILDGTAGKNTIEQAKAFNDLTSIDGIIITKMDTNSKVGMIINIAYEIKKPIYFLTNGEKVENIQKFDYSSYIQLLLGE